MAVKIQRVLMYIVHGEIGLADFLKHVKSQSDH